jgi:flavin reductase (DIM6/NTAB) family NADH-FMN oxidoreductase RutF
MKSDSMGRRDFLRRAAAGALMAGAAGSLLRVSAAETAAGVPRKALQLGMLPRNLPDEDKFKLAKLTVVPASKVAAPLVEESPVNIECKVVQVVEVGDHVWFMGEVLATHVREGYDWKEGLLLKWVGEDGFYHKVGKSVGKY